MPSICLRPLRILERSEEEMFEKATERSVSILTLVGGTIAAIEK
jgi:hypothetical protein